MVDKKKKKSSKSTHKSSHSHRSSRDNNQGGEIPRDPEVDQAKYDELHQRVQLGDSLTYRHEQLVSQLASRKSGNETVEYLYSILINVDFQVIRIISSSANAARERRGVVNPATRDLQTGETDREVRFYQDWNRALAMLGGIAAMPQSLQQFTADEMALVWELAESQKEIADNRKEIIALQAWFQISNSELETLFKSGGWEHGRDDEEDGAAGAAGGSELYTGEYVHDY
ncbi:hypothetical protein BHE90_006804 [Fusarium euwallaceae]|uniref:Uncharacterized protein n=1 Tax=Fusarium euwallaceae TaxID=1147111 RepID=A0A430LSM8_9HYPO|nr:hypothetical protein BHE90_006804 [Fusarium euwallaceae]